MRFDCLDLIRFGHFCGEKIEFPACQPDFYVLFGKNEAGKTTLLRGISDLLFGVPVTTPDVHSCKGHELRIGAAISQGRQRFSFRRRKGTTGTLLNLNESQIADDALAPFLRELDRSRFEQLFGLDHQRLREGGEQLLRGEGDVGSALFQAAGLLELRNLLAKLDNEAKDFFSPHASKKTIARVINEYRQAKSEISRLAVSGAEVKKKQSELEAAKADLARLKTESQTLQLDLERLRRIKSNKPDLARLHHVRADLAHLEHVPMLPADAARQRDDALTALAHAQSQIDKLMRDINEREQRIQSLPVDSLLRQHETEIRELNAGTTGYLQSVSHRAKRERERDAAVETAEADWKSTWVGSATEADSLRNVYSSKQEILNLVAEYKGLTAELRTAEDEFTNVVEGQEQLKQQVALHPELSDPAELVAAIDHAKSLGDTGQMISKLWAENERLARSAQLEIRKLTQWSGTIDELENLKTPLMTTIEQYAREWESQAEKHRELSMYQANALQTIRRKERELESLTAHISGAGENELASARARRDELWQFIRAAAFEKTMTDQEAERRSGSPVPLANAFAAELHKADKIADTRFANAKEVAIHDRLTKEIAAARSEQQGIEDEIQQLERAEQELRERWSGEWKALAATPLSPVEMKEWMQARQGILLGYEQAREKEGEAQFLQKRIVTAIAQITGKWAALAGDVVPETDSLPIVLRMAQSFAEERERKRQARAEILQQIDLSSVEKRRTKLEDCKQRLLEWSREWSPYVQALRLPGTSTPDQVARALSVLEKVFQQLDKADDREHRVKTIGDDIEAFKTRVSKLTVSLGVAASSSPPEVTVKQLHSQLVELGNAETERETLKKQNEKDRGSLDSWREKGQLASATLEKLRALAVCAKDDEQQLDAVITASEHKSGLLQERKRISDGLIERNANTDLEQIEQEASGYELDLLGAEIDSRAARVETVIEEISRAASKCGELTSEFERLETSEGTALQAQRAEESLAQLRPAVAQYLRLRLASEVLQQAMDSYREKHQEPILKRASELFSRITLGDHSGLTSDFGENDKPVLVAIRQNGERVHVAGLSDGTLDQLYLSLRLAAIEHHVETVAPCPVIFDDLLINSDDVRATAALQVIGDLAKRTQVLFFTHHGHLADLGIKAGAQVIELGSLAVSAVA